MSMTWASFLRLGVTPSHSPRFRVEIRAQFPSKIEFLVNPPALAHIVQALFFFFFFYFFVLDHSLQQHCPLSLSRLRAAVAPALFLRFSCCYRGTKCPKFILSLHKNEANNVLSLCLWFFPIIFFLRGFFMLTFSSPLSHFLQRSFVHCFYVLYCILRPVGLFLSWGCTVGQDCCESHKYKMTSLPPHFSSWCSTSILSWFAATFWRSSWPSSFLRWVCFWKSAARAPSGWILSWPS